MSTSQLNYSYGGIEGRNSFKSNGGAVAGPPSIRRVEGRNYLKPNGGAVVGGSSLRLRPLTHQSPPKNSKAPINTSNGKGPNFISLSPKVVELSSIRLRPPTDQGSVKNSKAPITTAKKFIAEDKSSKIFIVEEKAVKETAKTDAAKKSHKDAERRRRERINNKLGTLRKMVVGNASKTNKASLLTTVVKCVKDLKKRTADAIHNCEATKMEKSHWAIPSEKDEIAAEYIKSDEVTEKILSIEDIETEGERSQKKKKLKKVAFETKIKSKLIKVTFSCEDRVDLYKDVNRAITNVKAKVVKAEMSTVGRRVKCIFVIQTGCELGTLNEIALSSGSSNNAVLVDELGTVRRALKAVIEKATRMADYGHRQRRFNHYH